MDGMEWNGAMGDALHARTRHGGHASHLALSACLIRARTLLPPTAAPRRAAPHTHIDITYHILYMRLADRPLSLSLATLTPYITALQCGTFSKINFQLTFILAFIFPKF